MKKRVNGAWEDDNGYIVSSTHVDYTLFPIEVEPTYTPLNVVISGNMSQTETPTPEDPIQPQECGDLETTGEHAGQYKIPILSNSTTTNVYLGEVQSTRRIKKLVLTGQETWTYESSRTRFYMSIPDVLVGQARSIPILSTHFVGVYDGRTESQVDNNSIYVAASTNLYIKTTDYSTETAFTEFLKQQYAADTPVTVWYTLATPTTGIVNEPLRKIDDYADEVYAEIPVTIGEDTIDISTTLKPSKLSILSLTWILGNDYKRSGGAWS